MFGGTPQIGGSHSSSVYPANTPNPPPSATKGGQHQQHHPTTSGQSNHYSNHMLVSPQPLKLNQTGPTLLQSRRSNRHTAHGGMLGANIYQPDFRGGGSGGSACGAAPANGTVAAADQHRPGSAVGVHQVHQSQSGHVQLQQQPQAGPQAGLANGMSPDLRSRGLGVGGKMHYGGATSSTNPRVGGGGGGHLNATSPMTGAAMGAGVLTAGGQRAVTSLKCQLVLFFDSYELALVFRGWGLGRRQLNRISFSESRQLGEGEPKGEAFCANVQTVVEGGARLRRKGYAYGSPNYYRYDCPAVKVPAHSILVST